MVVPEIVEHKVCAFGEELAVLEQGSDLLLMPRNEPFVRVFIHAGALEFHAVAFGVALNLAVAKHGQARKSGKQCADTKVFVAGAKLVNGGTFIRIRSEERRVGKEC